MGKRLVLWDIDKTLIDVDGIGFTVFSKAFAAYCGHDDHIDTRGAGRTEWQWFTDTLHANGLDDPDGSGFARFLAIQDAEFEARAAELAAHGRVLPGAEEVLRRCAADPDVVSTLLTGNTRRNAERKMEAFGLGHLVDYDLGAYGDDHADRHALVDIARQRVHDRTGVLFTADTTVLVGDSPNDVRAAVEGGARIIALTTGLSDSGVLRAAGAEIVADGLADTEAVLREIHA